MRKIITTLVVGMAMILGITTGGTASAAPVKAKSVCETGHRGDKAYDAKCLKTGTFKSGVSLWFAIPAGKAGRENIDAFNRRSICKFSGKLGGIKNAVGEAVGDVAYDAFRNNGTVVKWAVSVAKLECAAAGYKIK